MWIGSSDELAQLIRDQRKHLRWSQWKLADRVGVSRQWIVSLEKGKATAEIGLVLKTLSALDLRLDVRDRAQATDNTIAEATAQVLDAARDSDVPPRRLALHPTKQP